MQIYFDACAIQRPLDQINHLRIRLEVEALIGIFTQVDFGTIKLVSSEVLELEINRILAPIRKRYASNLLDKAADTIIINNQIEQRARYFISLRIKPMDALHLACAEEAGVDYFCTCDDRLLKRAREIPNLHVVVVSPLELIEELEL